MFLMRGGRMNMLGRSIDRKVTLFTLGTSLSLLQPLHLSAAGFGVRNQSASAVGTALSSNGVNNKDVSGIFANPALLSSFSKMQIGLGLNLTKPSIKIEDAKLDLITKRSTMQGTPGRETTCNRTKKETDQPACNAADPAYLSYIESATSESDPSAGELNSTSMIPSIFFAYPLDEKTSLGASFTVPWATNSEYKDRWIGRYYGLKTKLVTYNLTLMASRKITGTTNFGIGLQAQRAHGILSSAGDWLLASINLARSFADKPWNDVDVKVTYDGTSTDYGYILGLTTKPTPQLDIGLSYRSAIQHKSKGSVKFEPIGDGAREYTAATVNNQPVAAARRQ